MGQQSCENALEGKASTSGNVGCRQQQQPGSQPRCESPRAGWLAGKTSLLSAREQMHMGMAAAVLPAEVPEAIAVLGWESWFSAFGFSALQEQWHCYLCAGPWEMIDYKQEVCGGCGFLFLLCLSGKVWGKCHFRGLWIMPGFIQGHMLREAGVWSSVNYFCGFLIST